MQIEILLRQSFFSDSYADIFGFRLSERDLFDDIVRAPILLLGLRGRQEREANGG